MRSVRAFVLIVVMAAMFCIRTLAQSGTAPPAEEALPPAQQAGPAPAAAAPPAIATQTPAPVTADPIKDPAAYLDQVAGTMLRRAAGDPSFELKMDLKIADGQRGTYVETWISPEKWRKDAKVGKHELLLIRSNGKTHRTLSDNDIPAELFRLSEAILPDITKGLIPREMGGIVHVPPMPIGGGPSKIIPVLAPFGLTYYPLRAESVRLGKIDLIRIARAGKSPQDGRRSVPEVAAYFIPDKDLPVLICRSTESYSYENAGRLGDKTVLLNGKVIRLDEMRLVFTTTSLTTNPTVREEDFVPPPGAHELAIAGPVTPPGRRLEAQNPVYPAIAKNHMFLEQW